MKRYVYEPKVKKLERVFPYSIEVPKGFRVHAQKLCREVLGKCYYRWAPQRENRWIKGFRYKIGYASGPWVVDEEAVWQYKDGRLYFKDPDNFGIVTMAMLSKPKKRA